MVEDQVPSQSELENAHCWFPKTDRAAGRPDITAFKQRARLHQAHWRERNGYVRGSHLSRDDKAVENGSKMAPDGPIEKDFRNFLDSEAIRAAVHDRLRPETKKQERGQQLREDRLRYDLLSSMPMCFNLFGELCGDRDRLTGAGKKLFGIAQSGVEVRFEHSPGRQTMAGSVDHPTLDRQVVLYEQAILSLVAESALAAELSAAWIVHDAALIHVRGYAPPGLDCPVCKDGAFGLSDVLARDVLDRLPDAISERPSGRNLLCEVPAAVLRRRINRAGH